MKNGKMISDFGESFTFVLTFNKEGIYEMPPMISKTSSGNELRSKPYKVRAMIRDNYSSYISNLPFKSLTKDFLEMEATVNKNRINQGDSLAKSGLWKKKKVTTHVNFIKTSVMNYNETPIGHFLKKSSSNKNVEDINDISQFFGDLEKFKPMMNVLANKALIVPPYIPKENGFSKARFLGRLVGFEAAAWNDQRMPRMETEVTEDNKTKFVMTAFTEEEEKAVVKLKEKIDNIRTNKEHPNAFELGLWEGTAILVNKEVLSSLYEDIDVDINKNCPDCNIPSYDFSRLIEKVYSLFVFKQSTGKTIEEILIKKDNISLFDARNVLKKAFAVLWRQLAEKKRRASHDVINGIRFLFYGLIMIGASLFLGRTLFFIAGVFSCFLSLFALVFSFCNYSIKNRILYKRLINEELLGEINMEEKMRVIDYVKTIINPFDDSLEKQNIKYRQKRNV